MTRRTLALIPLALALTIGTSTATADHAAPLDPLAEEKVAIDAALRAANELGYTVCDDAKPDVVPIDWMGDVDVAAWAMWPEMTGHCLIGIRDDLVGTGYRRDVAAHEVCHLITGPLTQKESSTWQVDEDPFHGGLHTTCVTALETILFP